jgi:hypothetical protein
MGMKKRYSWYPEPIWTPLVGKVGQMSYQRIRRLIVVGFHDFSDLQHFKMLFVALMSRERVGQGCVPFVNCDLAGRK